MYTTKLLKFFVLVKVRVRQFDGLIAAIMNSKKTPGGRPGVD